jgi:hypothetical protein
MEMKKAWGDHSIFIGSVAMKSHGGEHLWGGLYSEYIGVVGAELRKVYAIILLALKCFLISDN